jgi:GntR family transcriptional regulator
MAVSSKAISTAQGNAGERRVGYRDILVFMLGEVHRGRWPVGSAIISEADLVDQFGTTRTTVRQALKELETLGYIKRRRGTRSILISTDPSNDFVNSVRSIGELLQYSQCTRSKLLGVERVTIDETLAEHLGGDPEGEWFHIEYLRTPLRGSLPIGYSEIYLDPRYGGIIDHLDDNRTVYSILEEEYGTLISRVEQEIQAVPADERSAQLLKVDIGSPIMLVRTRFITSTGVAVEVGLGHFPAGRFLFEMVLERTGADRLE